MTERVRYRIDLEAESEEAALRLLRELSYPDKDRGVGTVEVISGNGAEASLKISKLVKRRNGAELRQHCRVCGAKSGERCRSMRYGGDISSTHKGRDDGKAGTRR